MKNRLSLLQKASPTNIKLDPYPYIVLPNALPDDVYKELEASFPTPQAMDIPIDKNNFRWDYPAYKVGKNRNLPKIWRDFIAYHASQDFFDEIAALFFEGVNKFYPERFPEKENLQRLKAGIRKVHSFASRDILMDAMISGNTPVTEASSVRTSHLDRGDKLFSGLFYMRPETYDAVGGDLTISRYKPGLDTKERYARFKGPYIDDANLDVIETVRYDKNLLVLFINSLDSVHGVTVRQPSPHSRLFVNLVGELDPPLYTTERKGVPAHYLSAMLPRRRTGLIQRVKPHLRRLFG